MNSAHWSFACAPAPAVCRGAAEHCRPFDPKLGDPDWLTPQHPVIAPRSILLDHPNGSSIFCRLAARRGFDLHAIHRIRGRRAFGTTSRSCLAEPRSPPCRGPSGPVDGRFRRAAFPQCLRASDTPEVAPSRSAMMSACIIAAQLIMLPSCWPLC